MTKCLIVEDEPLAQRVLVDYIQQTPGLQLVHTCASALEALPLVSRGGIDLLFLDLQLPGLSGPAFIQALPQPPAFICTTAYPEYAAASYDWGAVDYLLKPIAYARFAQSLAKYWQQTGAVVPPAPHTYFKVNARGLGMRPVRERLLGLAHPLGGLTFDEHDAQVFAGDLASAAFQARAPLLCRQHGAYHGPNTACRRTGSGYNPARDAVQARTGSVLAGSDVAAVDRCPNDRMRGRSF
jgi:CheY-like chemotaxis protein